MSEVTISPVGKLNDETMRSFSGPRRPKSKLRVAIEALDVGCGILVDGSNANVISTRIAEIGKQTGRKFRSKKTDTGSILVARIK